MVHVSVCWIVHVSMKLVCFCAFYFALSVTCSLFCFKKKKKIYQDSNLNFLEENKEKSDVQGRKQIQYSVHSGVKKSRDA